MTRPAEIAAEAARVAAEMPALLRNGQDACVDRVLFIGVDNDLHSIEFRDIWALLAERERLLAERERLRGLVAAAHIIHAGEDSVTLGDDTVEWRFVCSVEDCDFDAVMTGTGQDLLDRLWDIGAHSCR